MKVGRKMDSKRSYLKAVALKELQPQLKNAKIIAIIIAKQRPRKFAIARTYNQENNRGVWNFTIRDTPQDYVNVSYWGSVDDVFKLNDTFKIGDIVEIIKPKIKVRQIGIYAENFQPVVTSPYTLILHNVSDICHPKENYAYLYNLMRLPTKPLAGFVRLSDVQSAGSDKSQFVDILVAVASVGPIRSVKTKEGIDRQVRDLIVFDQTSPGMIIAIWDQELMPKSELWEPRSTILFMSDLRIEFKHFHNSYAAALTSRTVITENPEGPEGQAIRNFAKTAVLEIDLVDKLVDEAVLNPYIVQNVMSIRQVLCKMYQTSKNVSTRIEDRKFTALLYVFISQFDLDGLSRIITNKCNTCRKFVKHSSNICENQNCPAVGKNPANLMPIFDIKINLSDHTGTLKNCKLQSQVAENVLNCNVHEFNQMSEKDKWCLKWKYLLERCEVRILVLCMPEKKPLISVLACSLASPSQVASEIPHF